MASLGSLVPSCAQMALPQVRFRLCRLGSSQWCRTETMRTSLGLYHHLSMRFSQQSAALSRRRLSASLTDGHDLAQVVISALCSFSLILQSLHQGLKHHQTPAFRSEHQSTYRKPRDLLDRFQQTRSNLHQTNEQESLVTCLLGKARGYRYHASDRYGPDDQYVALASLG